MPACTGLLQSKHAHKCEEEFILGSPDAHAARTGGADDSSSRSHQEMADDDPFQLDWDLSDAYCAPKANSTALKKLQDLLDKPVVLPGAVAHHSQPPL